MGTQGVSGHSSYSGRLWKRPATSGERCRCMLQRSWAHERVVLTEARDVLSVIP